VGVRIDIWSDVVCPWCYLGHRRFVAARSRMATLQTDVQFRAFELDPGAPREPQPLRQVIERKYGSGASEPMMARLLALGAEAGIDYRFEQAKRVNTFDAHRVITWAATQAIGQEPVVDRLFQAYFTEGLDVADHDTLASLVRDVDGDAEGARAMLGSDEFGDAVRRDESLAREHEITGVPAFLIAERLMIPGAQDVDTFVRVLQRAVERLAEPT
jgi:predicted DsbA family dithiol-disulfide isomerase